MKYVMLYTEDGMSVPVIFPDMIGHDTMAKAVATILLEELKSESIPRSAGFCGIQSVNVTGKSETLGLESDPDDEGFIKFGAVAQFFPPRTFTNTEKRNL